MEDVGLSIPGNEIESASDADSLLVKINSKDLEHRLLVFVRNLFICEEPSRKFEDSVDGESAAAGGSVNHVLALLWIEHLYTHIDDMTWSEVLTLLTLGGFVDQIFECFIHNKQVGVKQFNVLEARDTDGQMAVGKFERGFIGEHAWPLNLLLARTDPQS